MAGLPHSVVARAATIADQMRSRLEPRAAAAAADVTEAAGAAGASTDAEDMQLDSGSKHSSSSDAAVLQALQQVLQQLRAVRPAAQQVQLSEEQQPVALLSGSFLEQLQTVQRATAQLLKAM
jgi:hypothetical protein